MKPLRWQQREKLTGNQKPSPERNEERTKKKEEEESDTSGTGSLCCKHREVSSSIASVTALALSVLCIDVRGAHSPYRNRSPGLQQMNGAVLLLS